MKITYLIALAFAAFVAAGALRMFTASNDPLTIANLVATKKLSALRCSPLYIPAADDNIPLLTGWGSYEWKISTRSDSAQIFFNQGINMYYAFHIIEARASFDKATKFDPDCAMAWWGKALAYGPNINDFGYQRPSEAYASATKANDLKKTSSPVEMALIDAMKIRYSNDSTADQAKLNMLYRDEMKKLFIKFQQNENVATLYADALMLLHPWDLYDHDYQPKAWTPEIIGVLKHTLALNPKQPGANHYFIHCVEASADPGRAAGSAAFLAKAMPDVSHVTHMPSHIYIRTGNYTDGIKVNDDAVAGYQKYAQAFAPAQENIALYELHNIHMKLNCAQMAGNYKQALSASMELQQKIPAFYLPMPGALGNYVQYLHQSVLFTQVRFGKWNEILQTKTDDALVYAPVLQHFARGIAFAKTKKLAEALLELKAMQEKMKNPALKEPLAPFSAVYDAALVGLHILEGVVAEQEKNYTKAIMHFELAVKAEEKLVYNEPRDWLLPARHYLGNALLKNKNYQKAIAVFNKDLTINPNNGWALTGLAACHRATNNKKALQVTDKRLQAAWLLKDTEIEAAVF